MDLLNLENIFCFWNSSDAIIDSSSDRLALVPAAKASGSARPMQPWDSPVAGQMIQGSNTKAAKVRQDLV